MKQKNLILVVVAVGCGLVAAFLTANMSAKQGKQVDTVDIPCAAKELPVGKKLTKEQMAEYVTVKKMPREQVPPNTVLTLEELAEKRVTRTLRPQDTFNLADVTANGFLNPPENHSMMTVRCNVDEGVAGFIQPGIEVDVIASVQMKKSQQWVVFPLFTKMLVLAVNSSAGQSPDGGAFANLSMVSFAVNAEQSLLLQAAVTRGVQMRLTLRNTERPVVYENALTNDQIRDVLADKTEEKTTENGTMSETPKIEMVKVKVPTVDLPAGTELSESIVTAKFKDVEYPLGSVPEGALTELKTVTGKYLVKDLTANFFVPKSAIGDKPVESTKPGPDPGALAQTPKTGPEEQTTPAETPKTKAVEKPKPVYLDVTVQTFNGVRKFRYQKKDDGEYIPLGEVPAKVADLSEKIPESKPEETIKPSTEKNEKIEETTPESTTPKLRTS